MQKTEHNLVATNSRRKVRSSTTLSRKYVKRPISEQSSTSTMSSGIQNSNSVPVSVKRSPAIERFAGRGSEQFLSSAQQSSALTDEKPMEPAQIHPLQITVNERMQRRSMSTADVASCTLSAKELKERAIQKALASASNLPENTKSADSSRQGCRKKASKAKQSGLKKTKFGAGRIVLATACAAVAVFSIVYCVNLNMPDLSLRVAAMQTGIEAKYPSYVPRDYTLSDITSEDGKVTLNFRNASEGSSFSLIEESSSWDSNALLSNFVKDTYGDDYTVLREQGLTIYISGNNACWVNGGVVYKLNTTSGSLTKKQLKAIATSL